MRKILLLAGLLIIFSVISSPCYAQSLEEFNVKFFVAYDTVVVKQNMVLDNPMSGNIIIDVPNNIQGLSVSIDSKPSDYRLDGNELNLQLESAETIAISYVTKDLLEGNDFVVSIKALFNISAFHVELTLPEDAVLAEPISDSTVSSGSAYPKPSEARSDGRSIILEWDYSNIIKGDEKSFFVRFDKRASYSYIIVLIMLFVLVIIGLTAYIVLRRPQIKEVEKPAEKTAEKPPIKESVNGNFEKHLKEDEEQVINILKQREGKCEQGTLRVITGFSKAKLSGLLKELEDRKIVHKEKRGKKNLVFLKEL